MNPNVIIIPNPTIETLIIIWLVEAIVLMETKMLSKHRSENVNNTITRSGGTSPSTNGQGLLLRFNYIMELFQNFE